MVIKLMILVRMITTNYYVKLRKNFDCLVKKLYIYIYKRGYKWEKRKYYPVNVPSGMESYFPIKKKIKLNLPKETEK